MNDPQNSQATRRDFLKTAGQAAAVSALAGVQLPFVHAAGSEEVSVALIGCGGRGAGAAADAMGQSGPPTNLVAMVDVFDHKLKEKHEALKKRFPNQVKV